MFYIFIFLLGLFLLLLICFIIYSCIAEFNYIRNDLQLILLDQTSTNDYLYTKCDYRNNQHTIFCIFQNEKPQNNQCFIKFWNYRVWASNDFISLFI